MNVLVTGGAGYIGSHTAVELLGSGHSVVIVDNFSNSKPEAVRRIERITGKQVVLFEGDVRDEAFLDEVFQKQSIDAVIHFAGLKAVGESVEQPLLYYRQNIGSALTLCETMQAHGVRRLIFSSSATVYGEPEALPLKETNRVGQGISNPYGQTKYMIEQILSDLATADDSWRITALRYFNPLGAHDSGLIGEDPHDIPNNLPPYISQVAVGKLPELAVFGDDYDTPDGTGVRDYIHVVDLARGHLAALEHGSKDQAFAVFNLGTGHGTSVLELVKAFEQVSGKTIPYKIAARRPGDLASIYADATKANHELGWKTEKTIQEACADAWRWQSQNPDGYEA